jgi:hypothetical protein
LAKELQQHRDSIASLEATQARLDADLTESVRRENDLREKHERDVSTFMIFEQRTRDAEAKTKLYLNELHTLRAEAAILRAKVNRPSRPATSDKSPEKADTVARTSTSMPSLNKFANGCDDCGADGTCPCVDSFLESEKGLGKDTTMAINTIISPPDTSEPVKMNSIPELVSDHSSPEDMEIDFTHAFKPALPHKISKNDRCGFCEDGGRCICAEAEEELGMSLSQPIPVAPPTNTVKLPGTCAQCQQNPEQKAYCESLAQARASGRGVAEGEPAAKRTRLARRDVQVPCADAYALYKQYSTSKKAPSYDEIYQKYNKANPSSRRGTATVNLGPESRQTQFSAYETDIAAVIATLHRQPTNSSKGGENAKT